MYLPIPARMAKHVRAIPVIHMKGSMLAGLITLSQRTPFRGRGGYGVTEAQRSTVDPTIRFRQAIAEAASVGRFYNFFADLPESLRGKTVLDFGCGYGGKTVEFARWAARVCGIEPYSNMVALAREYARHVGSLNAEFELCGQDAIPYPDGAFDVVPSHDVLEHVDNPDTSLKEIARVLKPGGIAYIVFPPYDGAFSHHLDYITLLPGLHWFFRPHTLIETVNSLLAENDAYGTSQQPEPRRSWSGERYVLPGLNGLTSRQFKVLAQKYFAHHSTVHKPIGFGAQSKAARGVAFALSPLMRIPGVNERLSISIAAVLKKAGRA